MYLILQQHSADGVFLISFANNRVINIGEVVNLLLMQGTCHFATLGSCQIAVCPVFFLLNRDSGKLVFFRELILAAFSENQD